MGKDTRRCICFHPFQGRPLFGLSGFFDAEVKEVECFHPFQGRPLFGLRCDAQVVGLIPEVSIPFREDLYSDFSIRISLQVNSSASFHPFQGRPLFGRLHQVYYCAPDRVRFPSLSGKTSIRTGNRILSHRGRKLPVSIPFREDLYSD